MQNISVTPAWYENDVSFDMLYPKKIQHLSELHWTPAAIAKRAARFLAEPGTNVLDIGSGIGKFCLIGAHHNQDAKFYGIEQRKDLYDYSLSAREQTFITNADFIHGNFTQVDLHEFDHFYCYNAFFEHLIKEGRIDQHLEFSTKLYHYYSQCLYAVLEGKPSGTRLATFHSLEDEIPPGFQLVDATVDLLLKMWIKR